MRFEWHPNLDTGGSALKAHADDYDGQPTPPALTMDYAPRLSTPGRLATAAVLAFRPFIAGAVTFPDGISPELASSISTFLEPARTFPGPLEFYPKAIPLGSGVFALEGPGFGAPEAAASGQAVSRLRLTSAGKEFGHQATPDIITVPTNGSLLESASSDPLVRLMPYLAAAVLMAEDFGIGTLRVPQDLRGSVHTGAVTDLLHACGLRLSFDG